jgi:hypothetical protein
MSEAALEATVTREEAFEADELQRLRQEAVTMVKDGVVPLEDISLASRLDDGQQLADGEDDAFRDAVAAELDKTPKHEVSSTPNNREQTGEGWQADDVVFKTIWDEFNFSETVSRTQLEGALDVSDHTNLGGNGIDRAIEYGVETDQIVDIPREMASIGTDETTTRTGIMYACGWSE